MAARFLHTNRLATLGAVLTVSSEQAAFPRACLLDEGRGVRWRSLLGWNIKAGVNDKIDFNRGGVKAATITAGNYATPAALVAAVVAALEAADSTTAWECSYGSSKFTISADPGNSFTLLFSTGANLNTSVHLDLGYTSTDKASAISQVAEGVAYKSRESIVVDLGAAAAVLAGIVIEHNLGASGTITQQGHTVDTAAGWAAPDASDVLVGDSVVRVAYRTSASKRYWRLLVNDVSTNTAGYTEIGLWFFGPYDEPSKNFIAASHAVTYEDLSTVARAISGAHRRDARPCARRFEMSWKAVAADRAILKAWALARPVGACSFVAFDTSTDIVYGYFTAGLSESPIGRLLWSVQRVFMEALP